MKIKMGKRLFCCLFAAVFVFCCFAPRSIAAELEEWRRQALEVFDVLEVILPRLAFFMVVSLFGYVLKTGLDVKKQEKASKRSSSSSEVPHRAPSAKTDPLRQNSTNRTRGVCDEDHFLRDRRNRLSQLDDWLKSGLIDRKEYSELKKRYKL